MATQQEIQTQIERTQSVLTALHNAPTEGLAETLADSAQNLAYMLGLPPQPPKPKPEETPEFKLHQIAAAMEYRQLKNAIECYETMMGMTLESSTLITARIKECAEAFHSHRKLLAKLAAE